MGSLYQGDGYPVLRPDGNRSSDGNRVQESTTSPRYPLQRSRPPRHDPITTSPAPRAALPPPSPPPPPPPPSPGGHDDDEEEEEEEEEEMEEEEMEDENGRRGDGGGRVVVW